MIRKRKLKVILMLAIIVFALSIQAAADGHILVFHRFGDDRYPSTNISEDRLIEIFDYLENNNYQVISLNKMIKQVKNDNPIADKTIALTIDDGYQSFYNNGLEIFKDYNYPFTLFINTKPINQGYGDFLTWKQVKEISQYGTIASHGYSHPHLTTLTESEIKDDINKSITNIRENLDKNPKLFSYPYGEYNQQTRKTIKDLGFEAIFNQNLGAVAQNSDLYSINRIAISDLDELKNKLIYDFLDAEWAKSEEMVNDGRLVRAKVQVAEEIEKAQLYVSGHGWQQVKLENGILDKELNLKLKYNRNRVFLKTGDNKISGKVLINYR